LENWVRFPHLMRSEILDGLAVGYKKDFLNACAVKTYKTPTAIFEQGEPSEGMALVAYGYVDVTYVGKDGQQVFLTRLRAGANLGEAEAITDEPCSANCMTAKHTTLLFCPKTLLFDALKNIDFLKNMTRIFYKQQAYDNWLKHVGQFGAVEQRLRGYLCILSENDSRIVETQSYLANVVGCSRQTINRELAKLRAAGVIAQNGSEIVVLDRDALGDGLLD